MGPSRAKHLTVMENFSNLSQFESSHFLQDGPALAIEVPDRKALAENLLGKSFDGMSANSADKSVVRGLLEEALGDALVQLSDYEGDVQKGVVEAKWVSRFSVAFDDSALFQIALPHAFAIEWRKKLAPAITTDPIKFAEFHTAISSKVIQLDAEVGHLLFDMEKMSNLKVGDVIELDRSIDESFPLRANGNKCEGIQARFIITQVKKGARRQPNIILEHSNE